MRIIARKPCCFGGKKFYAGDEIPNKLVASPGYLEKQGYVTIVGEDGAPIAPPTRTEIKFREVDGVTINAADPNGGTLSLKVSKESLQTIFDILGAKAAEAEGMVNTLDEDDALVLLHLYAPRKSIKDAAEARAKVLAEGGGQ